MTNNIEFLLKSADLFSEEQLILEIERSSHALRQKQHPDATKKIKDGLIALCMLLIGKEAIKTESIEQIVKKSEQVLSLHKFFTGREN